ncbi:MAG TPA: hypothetical protein VMS12_11845 [Thermoanaerobaculia bacterium]|nr:hypothetical protein [Thermoanaerobaculia bacterium]
MKRLALVIFAALLLPATLEAQKSAFGVQLGVVQSVDDDELDVEFDDTIAEIYIATELDSGTILKLKGGRFDTDEGLGFGAPGLESSGTVEYAAAVIEYRFYEVFGSTALFAGPGVYRQKFGTFSETDWGGTIGVNGLFPITRRLGFTAEVGYHWANFESSRKFLTATGGLRVAF